MTLNDFVPYILLGLVCVAAFLAVRMLHRAAVREATAAARDVLSNVLNNTNRVIEVKFVDQLSLPWPKKLEPGFELGFIVMRFDSGSGWMREDAFTGPDAYTQAVGRVAKLREQLEDGLRREIRARLKKSPDIDGFTVKPREIFIMPVVVARAYVDPKSVEA